MAPIRIGTELLPESGAALCCPSYSTCCSSRTPQPGKTTYCVNFQTGELVSPSTMSAMSTSSEVVEKGMAAGVGRWVGRGCGAS